MSLHIRGRCPAGASAFPRPCSRTIGASHGRPAVHASAVFGVGKAGFLPAIDPPTRLRLSEHDAAAAAWEQVIQSLPVLAAKGVGGVRGLRQALLKLPSFPVDKLLPAQPSVTLAGGASATSASGQPSAASGHAQGASGGDDDSELWRAYLLLSFLSHAYIWCEPGPPPASLPAVLAVPWTRLAAAVGMPPVLTYATYNLLNWKRLDPSGPIQLGNIASIDNFLGGPDEEWFRLVHVDIEARAGAAVAGLAELQRAAGRDDADGVLCGLASIATALRDMQGSLARMGEHCDPRVYYEQVRPPISGWRNNPLLPQGLVYEGVSDVPVQLYGATGAQSSVVPAFDRALGVQHDQGRLREYLDTMQQHMPPQHRAFLAQLETANDPTAASSASASSSNHSSISSGSGSRCSGSRGSSSSSSSSGHEKAAVANVREYVLAACGGAGSHARGGELRDAYDSAVGELERFRSHHRALAQKYIVQMATAAAAAGAAAAAAALVSTPPVAAATAPPVAAAATASASGPAAVAAAAADAAPGDGDVAGRSRTAGGADSDGRGEISNGDRSSDGGGCATADSGCAAGAAGVVTAVTGTGGSNILPALTSYRDATARHKIGLGRQAR